MSYNRLEVSIAVMGRCVLSVVPFDEMYLPSFIKSAVRFRTLVASAASENFEHPAQMLSVSGDRQRKGPKRRGSKIH
jgi:hypothetical protein